MDEKSKVSQGHDKLHKTIILDEPLNGMSDEKVNVVTELLVDVCKDFGLQMIMVTHHRQMADYADKVFILWKYKNFYSEHKIVEY